MVPARSTLPPRLDLAMPYLADLTVRLAEGLGRIDAAVRERHATYLIQAQNNDGGFSGREGNSDLYYTGFALRGLALLGELHGPRAESAARFVRSQLGRQVAIIDFLSLVYSGLLLEMSAGVDPFVDADASWRVNVADQLERFRRADGGYAKTDEGQSSSTYYTFLMVLCLELIGRTPPEPERIVSFIRSRQRDDGGFVELGPMQRSGTNPTAAAIGTLKVLGAIDVPTRERVLDYLVDAQTDEGGLRANTRVPIADVLSTFTGLLTMVDLDAMHEIEAPPMLDYVQRMQMPGGGFRGGEWDDGCDVEYTFYGLGGLGLLTP